MQIYFDDLQVGHAERFGSYLVSREEVIDFASKYDPQPYHLDDEAAAANEVFGRISASAVHTFAITSRLIGEYSAATGFLPFAGLGLDEMRILKPVFPGDTLSAGIEIVDLRESNSRPDRGIVSVRIQAYNQRSEPVLRYIGVMMFMKRPADAG